MNLTAAGHPSYAIHERVAYDFPELDRRWRQLAARTDAVTFGTLAQRTATGAAAIAGFLAACPPGCVRLLDVNLRQRFWSQRLLQRSLRAATALKLNDEELPAVAAAAGVSGATADAAPAPPGTPLRTAPGVPDARRRRLPAGGGRRAQRRSIPAPGLTVADTVGAGDAFAAAVLYHLLRGSEPAADGGGGQRLRGVRGHPARRHPRGAGGRWHAAPVPERPHDHCVTRKTRKTAPAAVHGGRHFRVRPLDGHAGQTPIATWTTRASPSTGMPSWSVPRPRVSRVR